MRLGVARAVTDDRVVPGDVDIHGDRIAAVGVRPHGRSGTALAGLVDLQVNGFDGVDLATADADGIGRVERSLARLGVTAYLPTVTTAPLSAMEAGIGALAACQPTRAGARRLGVHVEGPFLSSRYAGVHPLRWLRTPEPRAIARLVAAGPVRMVTLAPELPGAAAMIRTLCDRQVVVSAGHSGADASVMHTAIDDGVTAVTHLFNGMRPVHHRDAGIVAVALTRSEVAVGLIADGIHVADDAVRLAWAAAGPRVVLVSDAVAAAGRTGGRWSLGSTPITMSGGVARRDDGVLAGATASLWSGVRRCVGLGIDLATAVDAATRRPARLIGAPDVGRLRPSATADVVVVDDALDITGVWVAGTQVR